MDAKKFLAEYAGAWEERDAEAAARLFTEAATYRENPFNEPVAGREGIRAYWQGATATQKDVRVTMGEPHVDGNLLLAEWSARYTHILTGERRELRGILLAEFNGQLVKRFWEYWHRQILPSTLD